MPASFTVTESFEDRDIDGDLREKKYTRKFWAVSDIDSCNAGEVAAAAGIPLIGSTFEGPGGFVDTGVYCSRVVARQRNEAGPRHWMVTCYYTSRLDFTPGPTIGTPGGPTAAPPGATGSTEQASSPLLRPFKVSWGKTTYQKAVIKDIDGAPIVNSAYDRYDPPPTIDAGNLTLTIVKNQASFDPLFVRQFWHTVNALPWIGLPAATARCNSITAESGYELGVSYWEVRYEFEIAQTTWDLELLSAGFNEWNAAGTEKVPILISGRAPTTPQLLNDLGVVPADPSTFDGHYMTYSVYDELDFNDLGIFG